MWGSIACAGIRLTTSKECVGTYPLPLGYVHVSLGHNPLTIWRQKREMNYIISHKWKAGDHVLIDTNRIHTLEDNVPLKISTLR